MYVAPRATDPQHIQHAVKKTPIVLGRTRLTPAFGRQKLLDDGPLFVRRVASCHECLLKSLLDLVDG